MGADGVKLSVHMIKDGKVVVIYDSTVNRIMNSKDFIKDLTLRRLKELDAGIGFGEKMAWG